MNDTCTARSVATPARLCARCATTARRTCVLAAPPAASANSCCCRRCLLLCYRARYRDLAWFLFSDCQHAQYVAALLSIASALPLYRGAPYPLLVYFFCGRRETGRCSVYILSRLHARVRCAAVSCGVRRANAEAGRTRGGRRGHFTGLKNRVAGGHMAARLRSMFFLRYRIRGAA